MDPRFELGCSVHGYYERYKLTVRAIIPPSGIRIDVKSITVASYSTIDIDQAKADLLEFVRTDGDVEFDKAVVKAHAQAEAAEKAVMNEVNQATKDWVDLVKKAKDMITRGCGVKETIDYFITQRKALLFLVANPSMYGNAQNKRVDAAKAAALFRLEATQDEDIRSIQELHEAWKRHKDDRSYEWDPAWVAQMVPANVPPTLITYTLNRTLIADGIAGQGIAFERGIVVVGEDFARSNPFGKYRGCIRCYHPNDMPQTAVAANDMDCFKGRWIPCQALTKSPTT